MENNGLKAALEYACRGWCIIPIKPGDKVPACKSWKQYQTDRPDAAALKRWFGKGAPKSMGEVSGGLVCRDFDDMQAYERWASEYPEFAKTLPTVETGRPGRHVYAMADIHQIRRHSKAGSTILVLGDGELRGGGCYCLVPPSSHPTGPDYHWIIPLGDEVPTIDLITAGWLPCNREDGEGREYTEDRENIGGQKTLVVEGVLSERTPTTRAETVSVPEDNGRKLPEVIETAIKRTLPTGGSQRHKQVFALARELKGLPALADAPLADLKPIVRQWHKRALASIKTKPFEETWFDFCEGWGKVRFPAGKEPMAMMVAKAMEAELPEVAKQYEQQPLRLLVAVCRELQRASGDGPFFLSARTAGKYLEVSHVQAWRWLRGLQHDGILQLVSLGSQAEHKASRFRYVAK
jgi:hypothetical protein